MTLLSLLFTVLIRVQLVCPACGSALLQVHTPPYPCASEVETHYSRVGPSKKLEVGPRLTPKQVFDRPLVDFTPL